MDSAAPPEVFPRERRFALRWNCDSRLQPVAYCKYFSYTWKPEATAVSSNSIKVNGVEVKCDVSKPTVININFSQPVAPSCFQDFCTSVGNTLKPLGDGVRSRMGSPPMPSANMITEVKVGLQTSRIVLGVVSISLGVLLSEVHNGPAFEKGAAFWTGIPFILSGILSLVRERTTSRFWLVAASLTNLTSLVVSIAGIIVIANDLNWWYDYNWSSYQLCERQSNDYYYNGGYGGGYTRRPPSYEDFNRKQQCSDITGRLLSLFHGVRVLMLVVTIFALIVNLCCGLSDLTNRCCTSRPRQDEADSTVISSFQPLGPSVLPPAYEEKKKDFQTL